MLAKAETKTELVREAYGSSIGSDNWIPEADLNEDGIVNIFDLALASKYVSINSGGYGPLQGDTTIISVEPMNTSIGSTKKNFSINIDVTDALDTWAWQFRLNWNPSVINITNITEGTFLSQGIYDTSLAQGYSIITNYTEGWVLIGNTLLEEPASYPSGDGTLAVINFTILSSVPDLGNSALHLSETYLIYSDGETNYSHNTSDGYFIHCLGDANRDGNVGVFDLSKFGKAFGSTPSSSNWDIETDFNNNNVVDVFDLFVIGKNYGKTCVLIEGTESAAITTVQVEPEKSLSPLIIPNTTFDVNVSIDQVDNLYAYGFKLNYDPNVLTVTNVVDATFLNKPVWLGKKSIDNSKGEVQFEITSWTGALPKTGKGALATVTFRVKDFGKTNLDLQGTKLADYNVRFIGHDVEDGYFINYLSASVDIDPNTLNLNDKGKWITAYIKLDKFVCGNDECEVELGETTKNCPIDCPALPPAPSATSLSSSYDINNINISTVKLKYNSNYIPAEYGEVRNETLVVKFNRKSLQSIVPVGEVQLTVLGRLVYNNMNLYFEGMDAINVINK